MVVNQNIISVTDVIMSPYVEKNLQAAAQNAS